MTTRYVSPKGLRPFYLGEWLDYLGVKQIQLANRMETNKENISRWIKEPNRVTLDIISGCADALIEDEPMMRDASILLQPPNQVREMQALREAARRIVENPDQTDPPPRPSRDSYREKGRRLPSR